MTRIIDNIRVLRKYSNLLRELVMRDIKVRYRRSVLGLLWTVLNPLFMMIVITIVFSTIFKQEIPHFPIYYLSGSLLFSFNSESTSNAMYSILSNASLTKKVYIPKYLFPLSNVISAIVNLLFSLVAMFIVMLVTGAPFYPTLFMLPIPIMYTALFAVGLGLFLAAIAVRFRDITHFYSVFVLAWTYFTPIFYPASRLPEWVLALMKFNPMYHFVGYSRDIVLNGIVPGLAPNLYCITFSLLMLTIGLITFYKLQDDFVLYV